MGRELTTTTPSPPIPTTLGSYRAHRGHGNGDQGERFLAEYGARDLNLDHIEYALLARALRDMAARVLSGTDRPGVYTWGFRRIAKLDRDLAMFRPFCA